MTIASDILNRLSDDAQYVNDGAFYTAVFTYGQGVIELCEDAGYQATGPDEAAYVEIEANLGSAETYTEGQTMPAAIESTYLEAKFAFKHFRGVIRENGHERRRHGSLDQGARVVDPDRKLKRCIAAIKDKIATTFDDNDTYGLQGQVSASVNYGDQSRTTYAKLKAYSLAASNAAVSTNLIGKWLALAADSPYGCRPDVILCSATQAYKIAELGATKAAWPDVAKPGGLGLIPTGIMLHGAPVIQVPNLLTSTVYALSGARMRPQGVNSDGDYGERTWKVIWGEENPGRFHVLDLGANNTDTPLNLQISTCLVMLHTNPNMQAVLTGLSSGT